MKRRSLLKQTISAGLAAGLGAHDFQARAQQSAPKRRFKIDLTPGAIGVKADPAEVIELAVKHGFESVQPNPGYLASLDSAARKEFVAELKERGLVWGAAGLPVDFRGDEEEFRAGMAKLPKQAAAMQDAGVTRVGTWLKPFHNSLTWLSNFHQHAQRLGRVTAVLADHGIRFGLEYVGTKTLWTSQRYSFIHTMAETKQLIAEIDQPTLGFVLDSWHWFTAGETADDILTLTNSDVIACDLNDAPTGIPKDQLQDGSRELPAATGVIDIKSFLTAVAEIGYDGPVRAEPFNKPLRELDDGPAAEKTANAIRKAIEIAGV